MISNADIDWQTDDLGRQVPICKRFGDVYFSQKDGLSESDYVFIQHNDLGKRLLSAIQQEDCFVIAETGFGTGLNFLAVLCLWRHLKKQISKPTSKARLHFITTEKYPLSIPDLTLALSTWRQSHLYNEKLDGLIDHLIIHYPPCIEGCHRRHFDDVILDIWLGDALQTFQSLYEQSNWHKPYVDAWFLDGFSPSKNNQMWSNELFHAIANLSKKGTTLATFTSAGHVRRRLMAHGAIVQKVKGFGHKRDMLVATFNQQTTKITTKAKIKQQTQKTTHCPTHAIVIGAGIAGFCMAQMLAERGILVRLIEKHHPLAGASGNPSALLSPKLSQNTQDLGLQSFLYATHFYQKQQHSIHNHNQLTVFDDCGVVDFLLPNKKSDAQYQSLINHYPNDIIHRIQTPIDTPHSFSAFLPNAGLIYPSHLAQVILNHPLIEWTSDTVVDIKDEQTHAIVIGKQCHYDADIVVICAGHQSPKIHLDIFDGRKIRGQVSWLDKQHPDYHALKAKLNQSKPNQNNGSVAIKYDGYVCANNQQILIGASFVRNSTDRTVHESEHLLNLQKLYNNLNIDHIDQKQLHGRASIRLQTPDYHPIVGQISPSIYSLTALGSKGFCFAPLCAQILINIIHNEFLPIHATLLAKISPKRPRLQTPIIQNDH